MSDYDTPSDEDFAWQPQHEGPDPVVYPPCPFTGGIDDPDDAPATDRDHIRTYFRDLFSGFRNSWGDLQEYVRDFWDEVKRLAPLFLARVLDAISQAFRPNGFGFLLMLLAFGIVFRLAYPLFSSESTNTIRVLDAEPTFLRYPYRFADLETSHSEEELSAASREALDEFRYYLGFDDYQDRDLDKARQSLDRAIALDPDVSTLHLLRASFLMIYFGDFDGATKDYTTAIELDNTLSGAFLGRGYCHLRNGLYARALRDLDMAIQLDQDPRAYLARGAVYEHLGLYHSAVKDYTAGIEGSEFTLWDEENDTAWFPNYLSDLFFRRGYTHKRLDTWDACVTDLDMYMDVDWRVLGAGLAPLNVYWNRAECLIGAGRYEKALADYHTIYEYWNDGLSEYRLSWVRNRIADLEYTITELEQEQ